MIYSTMNKPSKNMRVSNSKLAEMIREQQLEDYNADQESKLKEQTAINRDKDQYSSYINDYISEQVINANNRAIFLQNVKEAFITECIMKLYTDSMTSMNTRDKKIARNLVTRFVKENGAGDLINSFSTKNILLSEMSRITQKYYNKVIESCDACSSEDGSNKLKEYNLDTTIKDDFYKELENIDTTDASKLIKDRVADSIQQFIDDNSYAKMEYEDVIQQAQEKIASAKDEATIDEYSYIAKRKINEMRSNKSKNIFNVMVESLTYKAITDDSYKANYVHESSVSMDKIVEDTTLIYTMLEMVNTTNMVYVNEQFISDYIKSLK